MSDMPLNPLSSSVQDTLILQTLESGEAATIEQVVALLPELSWNQVFHAVDALSRQGAICLRRRGFTYELSAPRLAVAS